MELHTYLVFTLGAFVLVASPGADFIYVLSRSISQGVSAGFWAALGVTFGLLIHTAFAVLGLTALLYSSAIAFLVVKYVGVCYLIYLGVKIFLTKNQFKSIGESKAADNSEIFKQGLFTNVLNPKAGLTFMAFMPQFLSANETQSFLVFQLGASVCLIALFWFTTVSYFSGVFRKYVVNNRSAENAVRYFVSTILISLGIRLAWMER
jgi:threonine/homoserine/homoserine lactone efflux protein